MRTGDILLTHTHTHTGLDWIAHLHEELGALRHEQLEDEGGGEAGNGAEHHEQPPALEVQRSQVEVSPRPGDDQPGQT